MNQRDIERLRALEKDIRDSVSESNATHTHLRASGWADRLATLIAELGQEAVAVAFATVRDGDDEWHIECRFKDGQKYAAVIVDRAQEDLAHRICDFLNSSASETSPAHTSEARDATRLDWLAYHGASLRNDDQMEGGGWFVLAPYHTKIASVDGRVRFKTSREAIDAAMRQEGGNG